MVLELFFKLDCASWGTKTTREFQLTAAISAISGKDVIVRAACGLGKTLAMILPGLLPLY